MQHIIEEINNNMVRFTEVNGVWYWQEKYEDDTWFPSLNTLTAVPIVYGFETLEGAAAQARELLNARTNVRS